MTIDLERPAPTDPPQHRLHSLLALGSLGWLSIAGAASLAAGAIHAAAIGNHSEHRSAVVVFTIVAVIQVGFGAVALARPGRMLLTLGALANAGLVGGWILAKLVGLPIQGLDAAEAVQFSDLLAAILAGTAALAVVAHLNTYGTGALLRRPIATGIASIVIAAAAIPGMLSANGHQHAGGHDDTSAVSAEAVAYDPDMPIDLGGIEGVTPQQQAAAENMVAVTLLRLPQFADVSKLESKGFYSIKDGLGGYEHYMSPTNMKDDKILDPDYPESLVFDISVKPKKLVSAMFMLNEGATLDDVPELGGKLTQWHIHDNLCFTDGKVSDLLGPGDTCKPPSALGGVVPMIHVWIEPHKCGPFSALDGVAAGSVGKNRVQACDTAHGASGHH